MSNKTSRNMKSEKTNPNILRRKRKAETDLEALTDDATSNQENIASSQDDPMNAANEQNGIPMKSVFSRAASIELLIASHPLNRPSTLPDFPFASSDQVWNNMLYKDATYKHSHSMFENHPELQPRMRAILLDWLIEVCEVYKLHRESFYLAQDLVDRYLHMKRNVPKSHLQLIGITSLFIAAKVEEIYPPKLSEFAYVTDGACTEKEILHQELVVLMSVNWSILSMTANAWLSVFLQVATFNKHDNENFEIQSFKSSSFGELCQLIDLCILDIGSLQFPYSVLATAAMAHLISKECALIVSGFRWSDIASCVSWMTPFVETISEHELADPELFKTMSSDMESIQTHNIGMKLLEQAQRRQAQLASGSPSNSDMGVLTPPKTIKKILL